MNYNINDIDVRGQATFDTACCSRIAQLKELWGATLPEYEAFVLKYGASEICDMIRIYSPNDILDQFQDCRDRWDGCFHWGDRKSKLKDGELQECYPIADNIQGDEFIYKTKSKKGIYVLPRDDDIVYFVGKDLSNFIDFTLSSGILFDVDDYYQGSIPSTLWIS
jgi:hypothetical protein